MKKIPIFLASLALALGGSVARLGNFDVNATDLEYIDLTPNAIVGGVGFSKLNLKSGQLVMSLRNFGIGTRTLTSYTLASFDYENGVTEEDADIKLATLGENTDLGWTNWYQEKDYTEKVSMTADVYITVANGQPLISNRQDIIYYAAKFSDLNDASVEPVWVRGKLDYRGCAHSQAVQSGTAQCSIRRNTLLGIHTFSPSDTPVISWNDELIEVARSEYLEPVENIVTKYEKQKEMGDESYRGGMEQLLRNFENAEARVEKVHCTAALQEEIGDLRSRIAALVGQNSDGGNDGGDDDNMTEEDTNGSVGDNASSVNGDDSNNGSGDSGDSSDRAGDNKGGSNIIGGVASFNNSKANVGMGEVSYNDSSVEKNVARRGGVEALNDIANNYESDNLFVGQDDSDAGVIVPNSGGVWEGIRRIILGGIAMVLVFFGILLWRRRKERDDRQSC